MIRVLHVFNCFGQGGIENFIMNVYRNIDREKIQFDFAFLEKEKGVFDDEVRQLGGKIYYFDSGERSFSNYKKSLTRIISENGPYAAVHSHINFFSGYVMKIAKGAKVDIRISHAHGNQRTIKNAFVRSCFEYLMRFYLNKYSTHMLGCSKTACEELFGKKAKFQVLYNGIDVERFRYNEEARKEFRRKYHIDENALVLLCIGRMTEIKNHDFLIDVFKKVSEADNNSRLILIGDGPKKCEIVQKLKRLDLYEKTVICSNVFNTEDFYSMADIFLLPSLYEGMGIVCVEAQASGLYTLLSSNVPGEVKISNLVKFLDLNACDVWADQIVEWSEGSHDRTEYNKLVKESCFNVQSTVDDLEKVYLG